MMKKSKMSFMNGNTPSVERSWQITTLSVQDQVVTRLREAITKGDIPIGERLVENDLARLLGVSRGPIRDALQQLTTEGLVDHQPRIGRFVRIPTQEDVKEVQEIRGVLEGLAARELAEQIHSGINRVELEALKELIEKTKNSMQAHDRKTYIKSSRLFHETLVELTENETLKQFHNMIMSRTALFRQLFGAIPERQQTALGEHIAVVDAILQGEADRAEQLVREHSYNGMIAIQKALLAVNDN